MTWILSVLLPVRGFSSSIFCLDIVEKAFGAILRGDASELSPVTICAVMLLELSSFCDSYACPCGYITLYARFDLATFCYGGV